MGFVNLIFKLGDEEPLEGAARGLDAAEINLCDSMGNLRFRLGSVVDQLRGLGLRPSEVGMDFALLGGAVYAADTRISRAAFSQDGWTREIRLAVPVSDVDLWNEQRELLTAQLKFLTGDIWDFVFYPRPRNRQQLVSDSDLVLPVSVFEAVCMFSGGLDSLVGAIDLLASSTNTILVSHFGGERKSSIAQRECFARLKRKYNTIQVDRITSSVCFGKDDFPWEDVEESTTRGRSFLFFSLAAAVASSLPSSVPVYVPENGLISLNIPVETLRLGALSTRTTHPYYMAQWGKLLEGVGLSNSIRNPYQMFTKGEMLQNCQDVDLLKELIPVSISCSNPTGSRFLGSNVNHCGRCVPCIIRRASIYAAFGDDETDYLLDGDRLSSAPLNTKVAEGKNYRAFKIAIDKIRNRPELARVLVCKAGPLSFDQSNIQEYADLYVRGMLEVASIVDGVEEVPA